MQLMPDSPLRQVTLEVEAHVGEGGWDQPPRLYALVPTTDLIATEPTVAAQLGLEETTAAGTLTPIEQEELPADRPLEDVLSHLMWPAQVVGCAAVLERLMLPPAAEKTLPDDPAEQVTYAAEHPGRRDVRIAVAVTREGGAHCAVRSRDHGAGGSELLEGPDLVPTLVTLLSQTLAD